MSNKKIKNNLIVVENLPTDIILGGTYSIAQQNPNTYTHIYFKYPCRFIPEIPRFAIKKYISDKPDAIIFDPFAGSGTTLLEANINGYNAFGTEIDAIAKLITKVKTTALNDEQIYKAKCFYNDIIEAAISKEALKITPKINNLEHWFIRENIDYLGKMLYAIEQLDDVDIKDFFKVCFISIIKKTSNADDISPKPYVSSKIQKKPANPLKEFENTFKRYHEAIDSLSKLKMTTYAKIINGDALNFDLKPNIDLAITSPPYINAFDYVRTLRLENLWLSTFSEEQLRDKKKEYVGTEQLKMAVEEKNLSILNDSKLLNEYYNKIFVVDKKRALIVKRFFEDMKKNLAQVYNSLSDEGRYMIVIGNSKIRSVEIESWKVLEELGKEIGFETDLYFNYIIQNPYIRIPRGNKGGIINSDYVLVLKKRG